LKEDSAVAEHTGGNLNVSRRQEGRARRQHVGVDEIGEGDVPTRSRWVWYPEEYQLDHGLLTLHTSPVRRARIW
jgi:hypothetical protein